jgi:hypothetical protein
MPKIRGNGAEENMAMGAKAIRRKSGGQNALPCFFISIARYIATFNAKFKESVQC